MNEAVVSTQWLADNIDNPLVRVVDVSEDSWRFETEHVPGAVNLGWASELQNLLRRDFVDEEEFEALLNQVGISRKTQIVLYGNFDNWYATQTYWVFKYYGYDNVYLLAGGVKQWKEEHRPMIPPSRVLETHYRATTASFDSNRDR